MQATVTTGTSSDISVLLRGEPQFLRAWCEHHELRRFLFCLVLIVAGAGLYGAAMGCWRAPLQAGFVAIKFPLIMLLTAIGNALLNGMLAPLLGLNLGFRKCFLAVLMSLTITSVILGSFSPLLALVVWNAPAMNNALQVSGTVYSSILLLHVGVIAFAGIAGNLRLRDLLSGFSGKKTARRVLLAWLVGNLFVGSQLSWILRPFIGAPTLPVQFLRASAFQGNFYETVFYSLKEVLNFN